MLALLSLMASAQDRGFRSEGREFYLGYLHPIAGPYVGSGGGNTSSYAKQYKVYALVSSYVDNTVELSYFSASGKEETSSPTQIAAGKTAHILLDQFRMQHDSIGDNAAFLSCHLRAKRPVSVQFFSTGPGSCGSYLALPVQAWGKKYTVASYSDLYGYYVHQYPGKYSSGLFTIVAAYDGTTVTISPSAATAGGHIGATQGPGANGTPKPYTISLARGQCYMVRSASAAFQNADDLSASIVTSTHPVAVIGGHEWAIVGDGNQETCPHIDTRDYMVEQMIPSEFWDNTGVISIPFEDSKGIVSTGLGENYRIYVADDHLPSSVQANEASFFPAPYNVPVELFNRVSPIHFKTVGNDGRFSAIQYDPKSHGTNAPFPSATMNTLIPKSQWRNSYGWSFPISSILHGCYKHYVTVIAEASKFDSIMISIDGAPAKPISVLKNVVKTWGSIPDHPELKAVVYTISPSVGGSGGMYFATAPFPFAASHAGSRASAFQLLRCPCYESDAHVTTYHYSYASPGGASLFDKDIANNLRIEIDTLCTGAWDICVTDNNEGGGIRYVSLIDDSGGYMFPGKSYKHKNVSIHEINNPQPVIEFSRPGDEKSYCFTIGINDPGADASAPVIIYDKAGNYTILDLRHSPQKLTVTPDPFVDPDLFGTPKMSEKICTTFTISNQLGNIQTYWIHTITTSTSQFTIESIKPLPPTQLFGGDSLTFDVCFQASDTLLHRDTVKVTGTCLDLRLPLAASTVRPILIASDVTFGDLLVGKTAYKPVTLKNTGQATFTVQGGSIIQSDPIFSFDSASSARFPLAIAPGATVTLNVCYTPDTVRSHTAFISWQTDIVPPFASEQKSITNLSGQGYAEPGVVGEHSVANKIRIRPNPARDKIRIEFDDNPAGSISVSVCDVLGREVAQATFPGLTMDMELPLLADGIYYVRIVSGGQVTTHPVEIRK